MRRHRLIAATLAASTALIHCGNDSPQNDEGADAGDNREKDAAKSAHEDAAGEAGDDESGDDDSTFADASANDAAVGNGGGGWTGLRVSGTTIVDGTGAEIILRGLGVGELFNIESYMINVDSPDQGGMGETKLRDALVQALGQAGADQFFATWEANIVSADDVAEWATWGVNSIRLPINYHSISSGDGAYIDAGFAKIDAFIGLCKAHGIYVILDLHAAPGAQNCEQMSDSPDGVAHLWKEPAKYRQWTIDLWKEIARRYANEPMVGGFDIFDEPYDTEDSGEFSSGIGTLRQMYVDITAAIRTVDARHILFFEGTKWSSIDDSTNGFDGLLPAWDPQMAWAFHKYWDDNTAAAFKPYLDLRTSSQRPIWNGETGEDTSSGWSAAMIKLCEQNKVGWNEWTFKKSGGQKTNPYTIPDPPNWSAMANYLANRGNPPSNASTIMTALAANAASHQCQYNAPWVKEVFGK